MSPLGVRLGPAPAPKTRPLCLSGTRPAVVPSTAPVLLSSGARPLPNEGPPEALKQPLHVVRLGSSGSEAHWPLAPACARASWAPEGRGLCLVQLLSGTSGSDEAWEWLGDRASVRHAQGPPLSPSSGGLKEIPQVTP